MLTERECEFWVMILSVSGGERGVNMMVIATGLRCWSHSNRQNLPPHWRTVEYYRQFSTDVLLSNIL
jgi:hypothetical protein